MLEKVKKLYNDYCFAPAKVQDAAYHASCLANALVAGILLLFLVRIPIFFLFYLFGVNRYHVINHAISDFIYFFMHVGCNVVMVTLVYLLYYQLVVKKQREQKTKNMAIWKSYAGTAGLIGGGMAKPMESALPISPGI